MDNNAGTAASVSRVFSDVLDAVTLSRPCFKKFYITTHPGQDGDPASMFSSLAEFIRHNDAHIVGMDVFGNCQLHPEAMQCLKKQFGQITWPVTWIQGENYEKKALTGAHAYAISGAETQPITLDGQIIGVNFQDDIAQYCMLGDLRPTDISLSRGDQTRQTFDRMLAALEIAGMDFSNVIRTWMYLDDLLSWYDEFNEIRTAFFDAHGIFDGVVPASTGIGVGNPAKAALITDLFAVKEKKPGTVKIHAVPSPLQCPATDYKSSFSRAVELAMPDHRRLYISGTASIAPDGKTVHLDDVEKQIALTMKVTQAILEHQDMTWSDVSRAIAYFKDINNTPLFGDYCRKHGIPPLPIAIAHSDICRHDLLFEIEVDAVVA